jgi:hypothetical protein
LEYPSAEPKCKYNPSIFKLVSCLDIIFVIHLSWHGARIYCAMQEALGEAYQKPTLEKFDDALIKEQDNLVQLGVIKTAGTSNKAIDVHQKYKPKNTKKQHPRHNNKQHKGPKPTLSASAPNSDKGAKYKNKKIDRHCNICDKDGHDESKCFKKMAALEAVMMSKVIDFFNHIVMKLLL